MSTATIHDVARQAGVSTSSVSRILRGSKRHRYAKETQSRVHDAARQLGYQVHSGARLLRQRTSTLIGMAVYFTEHSHFNRQLVEVHRALLERGYEPVLFNPEQLSPATSGSAFPSPQVLAGLISLGRDLEEDFPAHYAELRRRIPIVAINAVAPQAAAAIDVVRQDYEKTFEAAIEHLRQLGHETIAYAGLKNPRFIGDYLKYIAWENVTRRLKLPGARTLCWNIDLGPSLDEAMSVASVESQTTAAIQQLLKLKPRATGLICGSDEIALCLQSHLLQAGWQLPQQLSVVGIDGVIFGAYAHPPLTCFAADYRQTAKLAVARLLELISLEEDDPKTQPQETLVAPCAVLRASTTAPNAEEVRNRRQ